ncbi:MAG: hypothetical protein WDZ29_04750 [Balneolaceae bacterium]
MLKNIHDFISLLEPENNQIFNMSPEEAEKLIRTGDPERVRTIEGSWTALPGIFIIIQL